MRRNSRRAATAWSCAAQSFHQGVGYDIIEALQGLARVNRDWRVEPARGGSGGGCGGGNGVS